MNKILTTTKFVTENSNHVKINKPAIKEFCKTFSESHINHWLNESPFDFSQLNDKEKLHFLLVFDAMSFSYWGEPKWTIEYKGEKFDGAWGMIASLGKAIENKKPILSPEYLRGISEKDLNAILKGNTEIPLLAERKKILTEVGSALLKDFDGDFSNLIKEANHDAVNLLDLILKHFPSFNDFSSYKGKTIYFQKRAQLLVADINQMFGGEGYGKMENMDEITACADYKLPTVMRKKGILEYSKKLEDKIDNKVEILRNSEEEVEIRASTIWANEFIKKELKKQIKNINSIHVNDHLWLLGQIKSSEDKPYHRTRTTAY
ncbi:MAG: queuosine salvage family protein [Nanoarchaeota archaeon]|nr:queuosine salvage family protein [Nanoarchaeota archaeon]